MSGRMGMCSDGRYGSGPTGNRLSASASTGAANFPSATPPTPSPRLLTASRSHSDILPSSSIHQQQQQSDRPAAGPFSSESKWSDVGSVSSRVPTAAAAKSASSSVFNLGFTPGSSTSDSQLLQHPAVFAQPRGRAPRSSTTVLSLLSLSAASTPRPAAAAAAPFSYSPAPLPAPNSQTSSPANSNSSRQSAFPPSPFSYGSAITPRRSFGGRTVVATPTLSATPRTGPPRTHRDDNVIVGIT